MPTFENPGLPTFADTSAAELATIPSEVQQIDVNARRFIRFDSEPGYPPKFRSQDRYTASGGDVIDETNGGWWGALFRNAVSISQVAPGAGTGGIDNQAFADAIAAAVGTGLKHLHLDGRTLRFDDSSDVGVIGAMAGLTIDGGGAELIYVCDDSAGFPAAGRGMFLSPNGVGRLALRNMTLSMANRMWTQCVVTAIGNGTVNVEIDPAFPVNWNTVFRVVRVDPETGQPGRDGVIHSAKFDDITITHLSGNTYQLSGTVEPDKYVIGAYYQLTHALGTRIFNIRNCNHVSFDNVKCVIGAGPIIQNASTINGSGLSFVREDGMWLPHSQDLFHIKNFRGRASVSHTILEGSEDDMFNAHTDFMKITAIPNASTINATLNVINTFAYDNPDFRVGDVVTFVGANGNPITGAREIAAISFNAINDVTIQFTESLPNGSGGEGTVMKDDYAIDLQAVGSVEFSHNECGYSTGKIIPQARNTIVSHNSIRYTGSSAIDVSGYPAEPFTEGPSFLGALITHNDIIEAGAMDIFGGYEKSAVINVEGNRLDNGKNATTAFIPNVLVAHNVVRGSNIGGVSIQNCIAPVAQGNVIADVNKAFSSQLGEFPVSFRYCSDPVFGGNGLAPSAGKSRRVFAASISGTPVIGSNPGFDVSDFDPWLTFTTGGIPFTFATPGDLVLTGITENNRYQIREGKVRFEFNITATATHSSASGSLLIALPATVKIGRNVEGVIACSNLSVGNAAYNVLPRAVNGQSYMNLRISQSASSFVTVGAGHVPSGQQFQFQGWIEYEADGWG